MQAVKLAKCHQPFLCVDASFFFMPGEVAGSFHVVTDSAIAHRGRVNEGRHNVRVTGRRPLS